MPTVLITGASRGIGEAAAKKFANAGWDLLLASRNSDSLKSLSQELRSTGRSIATKSIDFSNPESISPSLAVLLQKGDAPSVLINNAGVAWTGDLLQMSLNHWQWMLQVNLTSVFQICAEVVPVMRDKGGLVINVSSHAARNSFPQWGGYCVSKAALESFTRCLAEEERSNGIRASTLTLGSVNTTLWDQETVNSDFDRHAMLSSDQAASTLLYMAEQPSSQLIEDLTLMPAKGAF
ncbi:SDR family oxidoreductase [Prochlorococcus sp. MIT 1300]|uniref:SDR family oxidoreductase n=1 Tax=Prochlorococcus sp. MIT 1300 TaxID=3096218 RepID=UPI002A76624A|nr:SDR family oxidoreductase [Prochlorococcus sp. MIT 1300]